jgi:ribosomal protein S3AE
MTTDQDIQQIKKYLPRNELKMFELFLSEYHAKFSKVEEMQKTMQDIHDKLNNGASHEFEETIQYCITKAFYALKEGEK